MTIASALRSFSPKLGAGTKTYVDVTMRPREMDNRTPDCAGDWDYVHFTGAIEDGQGNGYVDAVRRVTRQLQDSGVPQDPDVLRVHDKADGFHVLRAVLESHRPRVCITTYNAELPPELDQVAPYSRGPHSELAPWGASLKANVILANSFGYTLVACDPLAQRVVLVRRDLTGALANNTETPVNSRDTAVLSSRRDSGFLTTEHYLLRGVETIRSRYGWLSYFRNDEYIGENLRGGRYWQEPLVLKAGAALVEAAGWALDIGAHVGTHSIGIASFAAELSFLCFEPQRPLYLLLERNIVENCLQHRLVAVCCAIGHRTMRASMGKCPSDGAAMGGNIEYGSATPVNLGGIQLGVGGETCELLCVDDLLLTSLRYVKIDAEGAEPLVILGMQETLRRELPLIVFEDRDDRHLPRKTREWLSAGNIDMATAKSLLRRLGYRIHRCSADSLAIPCA
jgi:FkbM family methyltransferase